MRLRALMVMVDFPGKTVIFLVNSPLLSREAGSLFTVIVALESVLPVIVTSSPVICSFCLGYEIVSTGGK